MAASIVMVVLIALSPSGSVGPRPAWGGGGPDSFGYRWLDSDTVCPGAPVYNWIEIKGVGTEITNLMGDDNIVGPFPLPFDFPYYWYKVNQIYIGSNGYITFHDNKMNASPFQRIPSTPRSNNTLAAMLSDLIFEPSNNASLWYWSSADNDTFIVEFDSVPFWSTGGNNTFQIILSRPDSSITFQYKEQSGTPYGGWVPDYNQCGIENVSGRLGLNYLNGNLPPGNMYHPELAVKFIPPESTLYQVHDAGVRNALNDRSGGTFCVTNRPLKLWSVVQNYGNQPEQPFKVYMRILRQNGSEAYKDSVLSSALNPAETDSVNFPDWVPTAAGVYTVKSWTRLVGDAVPVNDSAIVELRVVNIPATLTYDKGTATNFMSWNGPGGFGNRFVPPVYPCSITGARMYMAATTPTQTAVAIFDDNGPGGGPGDTLYITTVQVSAQNWYTISPPSPIVITEGAFFVGGMSAVSSSPSFGMDSVPPLSMQGWEYTGVWAVSRDASMRDVMANANITGPVGTNEWIGPEPAAPRTGIEVIPSVVAKSARLRLVNPRGDETGIAIYDATGKTVCELPLVHGEALFESRGLAGGIYFARAVGRESSVVKVLVSR